MDLRYTPPPQIRAAVWLMLNVLSTELVRLFAQYGINRHTPLLPRRVIESVSRFLSQAEPALRRCLWLAAAELGALPASVRTSKQSAASRPSTPSDAPKRDSQPLFRLFETKGAKRPGTVPPTPIRTTGPRIRFLDTDDIPDIHEYPKLPEDILPAKRLVRRLTALDHALDFRQDYIDTIRRHLGTARTMIAKASKRLFHRGPLTRLQGETARLLEQEAHDVQPWFNSS
ncbi:hypothetical protein HY29_00115 [Hyphomonas beringensis]|uniref:Uncharacterized protein n=1 Tax=Hyphomonas beringensis TaxID=1280946 RepID=A0A062UM58_9PROT|nr:hypothetical protein [Hyphomonas beringensis]KCZ57165.1 hypothetical protein HY29_00115 [Hyphomonas beringensis]